MYELRTLLGKWRADDRSVTHRELHRIARLADEQVNDLYRLVRKSGLDVSVCSLCGDVIICLPEGGGLCVTCANEMAKSQ